MSPFELPPVFVVGAQRSGTTWVQRLLAAHPRLAGGQESHLVSAYLAPLWERWQFEEGLRQAGGRTVGLACYLTEAEFVESLQRFAQSVFAPLKEAKPAAVRLVEKTPDHALHLPLVHRLFPGAAVVHVLRDGRDVAASQLAAQKQAWGRVWAAATAADAARRWADWVTEVRRHAGLFATFHEVRYEELHRDGLSALARLYDALQVPLPAAEVAAIVRRFAFGRGAPDSLLVCGACRDGDGHEPAGFFREGRCGGWRDGLTAAEQQAVHAVAGPLLAELGYEVADEDRRRFPVRRRSLARRLAQAVGLAAR